MASRIALKALGRSSVGAVTSRSANIISPSISHIRASNHARIQSLPLQNAFSTTSLCAKRKIPGAPLGTFGSPSDETPPQSSSAIAAESEGGQHTRPNELGDQMPVGESNQNTRPNELGQEMPVGDSTVPKFDPRTLLDQGIPPTPEHYHPHSKPDPTASHRALDPTEGPGGPEKSGKGSGAGGGGRGKGPEYVSSADRKRDRLANIMFLMFLSGGVGMTVYLGRNWDTPSETREHPDAPNGWGPRLFYDRAMTRLGDMLDYYNLPNAEKLLPDHTPETYRPYTLVISLEDMLVHPEWTREHGWRTAKRPGVDYFLTYLSQYYEIAIFTSQPMAMAQPILAKLDPYRTNYQLFREATKYKSGKYIKDLTYLNRDLSKIIMIDTKEAAWSDQPENAIKMKPWLGNPNDKELIGLIPFLEYIATMGYADIRPVLKSFPEGSNIAVEFAKREALARAEYAKKVEEEKATRTKKASGGGFLMNLLGMKQEDKAGEKMFQDQVREQGKRTYEEIMKNLKEHGDEYLEMDKKMQEEAMAGMKTSLSKIFTEGLPQPQMPPMPPPEQKK